MGVDIISNVDPSFQRDCGKREYRPEPKGNKTRGQSARI